MKQFVCHFVVMGLVLALLLPACVEPTGLGADLLRDDQPDVGFTDTLSLEVKTIKLDSVLTYFPVGNAAQAQRSYLFGEMIDPIFGKSKAQLFAHVIPSSSFASTRNLNTAQLDSIVLVLPYDTISAAYYGNIQEEFGLAVHRMTQDMNPEQNYYSNATFQSEAMPLGTARFLPNKDSVQIIRYGSSVDTVRVPAQLRVPLTEAFGRELLQLDTNIYLRDSVFVSYFKGLHIKPTTVNQGMLSFNLVSANAGVFLYYTLDGIPAQIQLQFNPFWARVINFQHNYDGAPVQRYINNNLLGDSLVFVQGMSGLNTEITIPFIQNLKGVVINKAELEVRIAELPNDDPTLFKPLEPIMVLTFDRNGEITVVDDIVLLQARGQNTLDAVYGGRPQAGKNGAPTFYTINLSAHLQSMVNGQRSNVLRLSVFNRSERASRVALYGAKHPQYNIKMKIAYTRL